MYDDVVIRGRLRIVDDDDNVRLAMHATREVTMLSLYNADGDVRAKLYLDEDGDAGLRLYDFAQRCLLAISIGKFGPRTDLFDETARLRASVQLTPDQDVVLILAGEDGVDEDGKWGDDALLLGTRDALAKLRKPPDDKRAT